MAAKLTHGHPTGYLAAGAFAAVIAEVAVGKPLLEATRLVQEILLGLSDHEETLQALDSALHMANVGTTPENAIPMLGEGWVAEEALAISLYCALSAPNLEGGIINVVNITGDSDSTGAITGNLLGAMHGTSAIPQRWLEVLELRGVIEAVANDLVLLPHVEQNIVDQGRVSRYPPN